MLRPSARMVKTRMAGKAPILPQPKARSRAGYTASKIRKVTRKALRSTAFGERGDLRRAAARVGRTAVTLAMAWPLFSRALGRLLAQQARRLEGQDHHQQ